MRIEPFAVERWFVRYEFRVSTNIAESCIQPFTVEELCELCGEDPLGLVVRTRVGYTEGLGGEDLRLEVARLYPETGPDNVLITNGAIEANFLVAQALLEPGDTAICVFPAYQQLYSVPASTGAHVRRWELQEDRGWRPDPADLERLAPVGEPLRVLTVNFPHNPTGAVVDGPTMAAMARFAEDRGAYLHSDEVYTGLTLSADHPAAPSAREFSPEAIVTGSMSKSYGLPGARIGWIAGPERVVRRCAEIRDYVSICPSALGERLALIALRYREEVMRRNLTVARRNFALFREFLDRNEDILSCPLPAAGVVAFPRYMRAGTDRSSPPGSAELCSRLAREHGVLLVPGECFEYEHHFRIGFGYETATLERGLTVLEQFLGAVLRG